MPPSGETTAHALASAPTGLHSRLRAATSPFHLALEQRLDLLDPGLTFDRYRRILSGFYGYYEPLERRIGAFAGDPSCGFPLEPRASRLERDLLALDLSPTALADLPRAPRLPPIAGPADLAGCLYVIEGAALGGQVIARSLERHLGVTPARGSSFFFGIGPRTAARWRSYLSWLDERAATPESAQVVIARAGDTFRTLSLWLERWTEDP